MTDTPESLSDEDVRRLLYEVTEFVKDQLAAIQLDLVHLSQGLPYSLDAALERLGWIEELLLLCHDDPDKRKRIKAMFDEKRVEILAYAREFEE